MKLEVCGKEEMKWNEGWLPPTRLHGNASVKHEKAKLLPKKGVVVAEINKRGRRSI